MSTLKAAEVAPPRDTELTADVAPPRDTELTAVVAQHGQRGLRVQSALRAVLVIFAGAIALAVPPAHDRSWLLLVVAGYAVFAIAVTMWLLTDAERALQFGWIALFGDVVALLACTIIAGQSAVQSWTADLVINGFFVVPVLAATQLRPRICLAVLVPTFAAYLGASLATQQANTEPLGSVLLRAVALLAVCAGCLALSYIQRSRVRTIAGLLRDRSQLLADLLAIETAERQRLSEQLHDGALQHVLAARMDLEDVSTDDGAMERVETALTQASRLLRTTVGELYPAVLEQAGLRAALRQLAASTAERARLEVDVDDHGWPDGAPTAVDAMLFSTARELLANVIKHADAQHVSITVALTDGVARLQVADDGRGIAPRALQEKLQAGHIGIASHAARVHAAGGTLTVDPGGEGGTVARVAVPA